jgi:hypothetical protein
MEYRKSQSLGVIKCTCGSEIRGGEYGYVPVFEENKKHVFGRTICENCKNKKDQDGSFQPDPVALTGEMVYMNRQDANKSFWYVVARVEGEVDEPLGKWERFDNRGEAFTQEVYGRGGVVGKITYRYVCDELDRFLLKTEMQKKANELVKQPLPESKNIGYVINAAPEEARSL